MLSYNVENAALPGRPAPPMDREAMTMITLPLEGLYQLGPRAAQANAEMRAAEADTAGERLNIGIAATRSFYRVALAQVRLATAREVSEWLDSIVSYNRTRVTEGVAAEADLIRSELERDRALADATMQEADLAEAVADLGSFISGAPGASSPSVRSDSTPLTPTELDTPPESLVQRAFLSRPDLRAARERLAAASAGVSSQRSMIVRQLGVSLGTKRSAGTTSLLAGLSVPLPLFDQNAGEIRRTQAERDASAFALAMRQREVRALVTGQWEAARLLTRRVTMLATPGPGIRYLARADEARRIALGAYREGAVPLIQVIDATRAWADARLMYYSLLYAQHEAVIDLSIALGDDPAEIIRQLHATSSGNR